MSSTGLSQDPIQYHADGPIGRITLNRPEKRNALNRQLLDALREALLEAEAAPAIRVVVVAGAGQDFSAGADLAALQQQAAASVMENLEDADALVNAILAIRELRKPVVAVVRGRALAGGCGLATASDLVIAGASATFGYTEIQIGFVPAVVMALLGRDIGEKRALELLLTGELKSATEMERIGLINRVVPDDELDQAAEQYVRALAEKSASAVQLIKRQLYGLEGVPTTAAIRSGAAVNVLARMTDDSREGIARFLESRRRG